MRRRMLRLGIDFSPEIICQHPIGLPQAESLIGPFGKLVWAGLAVHFDRVASGDPMVVLAVGAIGWLQY